MLKDMTLIESNPPWYSPVQPKPVYEKERTEAYWDVPVYAESTVVKSNRVDVRIVDKEKKEVLLMEMTCLFCYFFPSVSDPRSMHHLDGTWKIDTRGTCLNRLRS